MYTLINNITNIWNKIKNILKRIDQLLPKNNYI